MAFSPKAQEIALGPLIIAALSMGTALILILFFTGKLPALSKETQSCATKGGVCKIECAQADIPVTGTICDKQKVCCIRSLTSP